MRRQEANYVVVHDVGEEGQEKDQADLNEALFERKAEIAAADALESKEKDVSSIENRDGEQIQDTQVDD